jgi:hypothetical protein
MAKAETASADEQSLHAICSVFPWPQNVISQRSNIRTYNEELRCSICSMYTEQMGGQCYSFSYHPSQIRLTHTSKEKGPSWEASIPSATQEISRILWN